MALRSRILTHKGLTLSTFTHLAGKLSTSTLKLPECFFSTMGLSAMFVQNQCKYNGRCRSVNIKNTKYDLGKEQKLRYMYLQFYIFCLLEPTQLYYIFDSIIPYASLLMIYLTLKILIFDSPVTSFRSIWKPILLNE